MVVYLYDAFLCLYYIHPELGIANCRFASGTGAATESTIEHVRGLTNFNTSKQQSIISTMHPELSEGQEESRVIAEAKAFLEDGWILDDEEVGCHFKAYTNALVMGVS